MDRRSSCPQAIGSAGSCPGFRSRLGYELARFAASPRRELVELVQRLSHEVTAFGKRKGENERYVATTEMEVAVRQADHLISQLHSRVSDAVCILVARALEAICDFWRADDYWKMAVKKAPDPFYKARNREQYAGALFSRPDAPAGAAMFLAAVEGLGAKTVDGSIVRGDIYRVWAACAETSDEVERLREQARHEYEAIPDDARRKSNLDYLDEYISEHRRASPEDHPSVVGAAAP